HPHHTPTLFPYTTLFRSLNVTAKDRATNNEQKITISSSSGLSKEEVDRMAKDAESHSADDRKNRDAIEARNRADAMIYNIEKTRSEEHTSELQSRFDLVC